MIVLQTFNLGSRICKYKQLDSAIKGNTNRGNPINPNGVYTDVTIPQCQRKCDEIELCQSFSYNFNLKKCWLKDLKVVGDEKTDGKGRSTTVYQVECRIGKQNLY